MDGVEIIEHTLVTGKCIFILGIILSPVTLIINSSIMVLNMK
jgi:hypothetical protein